MPDRDDSVDRLLRQAMRTPRDAGVTESCLDPETMAAWMDGGLSDEVLAAAEAHAATCARCQALLAAMARTEPARAPVAVAPHVAKWPERTQSWLPWLIPVAAAAVVIIAIAIPRKPAAPMPALTQMARQEAAPTAPPAAGLGGQAGTPPVEEEGRLAPSKDALKKQTAQKAEGAQAAATKAAESKLASRPVGALADAAVSAPPPPAATAGARSSTITGLAQSTVTLAPPAGVARAAELMATSAVVAEFASSDRPLAAVSAVGGVAGGAAGGAAGGGGGGRGGAGRGGAGRGLVTQQIAPQPQVTPVRWRVFASGLVERSVTAGAWEPVTIDPPAVKITGGVAPAPLVCWLVGREGVVLLSTDGLHFTRATFPETVDVSSIRAANAREATVTTVDGRVFVTTDGGRTWRSGENAYDPDRL